MLLCTCLCHKNMLLLYFDENILGDYIKTLISNLDWLNKCVNHTVIIMSFKKIIWLKIKSHAGTSLLMWSKSLHLQDLPS